MSAYLDIRDLIIESEYTKEELIDIIDTIFNEIEKIKSLPDNLCDKRIYISGLDSWQIEAYLKDKNCFYTIKEKISNGVYLAVSDNNTEILIEEDLVKEYLINPIEFSGFIYCGTCGEYQSLGL